MSTSEEARLESEAVAQKVGQPSTARRRILSPYIDYRGQHRHTVRGYREVIKQERHLTSQGAVRQLIASWGRRLIVEPQDWEQRGVAGRGTCVVLSAYCYAYERMSR